MINDTKKTPIAVGVFLHAILACFFCLKNEK